MTAAIDHAALAESLLAREPRANVPYALYTLWSEEPEAELARNLERRVFLNAFGNTPDDLRAEYGPYEPASLFFLVLDVQRRSAAGMIRIIVESPLGMKTIADLERMWGLDPSTVSPDPQLLRGAATWDIATLAVDPGYRGFLKQGVSGALYQAVCTIGIRNGIRWIIAVFDVRVLEVLQRTFRQPFQAFRGVRPQSYLGSPASLAVWCDGHTFQRRLRASDPAIHGFMFEGQGLENFVSQPAWNLASSPT